MILVTISLIKLLHGTRRTARRTAPTALSCRATIGTPAAARPPPPHASYGVVRPAADRAAYDAASLQPAHGTTGAIYAHGAGARLPTRRLCHAGRLRCCTTIAIDAAVAHVCEPVRDARDAAPRHDARRHDDRHAPHAHHRRPPPEPLLRLRHRLTPTTRSLHSFSPSEPRITELTDSPGDAPHASYMGGTLVACAPSGATAPAAPTIHVPPTHTAMHAHALTYTAGRNESAPPSSAQDASRAAPSASPPEHIS
jgi:hypothetical protein